jgi:hypothetical protein
LVYSGQYYTRCLVVSWTSLHEQFGAFTPGTVTVRHMYAATAVSDKGQFQGAVPRGSSQGQFPGAVPEGCAQGRQTACVYRKLLSSLPSLFFSL